MVLRGHRGRNRVVFGFTTTFAIGVYHHESCELKSHSWRGVLDTTLCDTVGQWLATGQWFSLGTPVSSNNQTDRHNITEILLKVALNTITLIIYWTVNMYISSFLNYKSIFLRMSYFRLYSLNRHFWMYLWKETLNSDGQQFYQHQQKEQSLATWAFWTQKGGQRNMILEFQVLMWVRYNNVVWLNR